MDKLLELGIGEEDIKLMLELVPGMVDMDEIDIVNKIDMLMYVDCNMRQVKNIIVSNPYYLDRLDEDILKLIKYLKDNGFKNLNLLFDMNPYFLNYDVFEIEDYINKRISIGMAKEDVVYEIEDNPYIID